MYINDDVMDDCVHLLTQSLASVSLCLSELPKELLTLDDIMKRCFYLGETMALQRAAGIIYRLNGHPEEAARVTMVALKQEEEFKRVSNRALELNPIDGR